jgi:hypothetical protein
MPRKGPRSKNLYMYRKVGLEVLWNMKTPFCRVEYFSKNSWYALSLWRI